MERFLIDLLICPACRGALRWTEEVRHGERLEQGEARCRSCAAAYPVREGIGVFLTPDLPRDDLWEQAARLDPHLRAHPDLEQRLMGVPPDSLGAADRFLRAMVLEERGQYAGARALAASAMTDLYTPDYLACADRQIDEVVQRLAGRSEPVVDLASGRGTLVERLAQALSQPVVASDFSPHVLRRDRRTWTETGLHDRISLLAFDARRTPFKDGAVAVMTSNLGPANVRDAAGLWRELRRIVSGTLLAVMHVYPDHDAANGAAIRQAGLESGLLRDPLRAALSAAGWQAEFAHPCAGLARPTPASDVIEGARIDGLPVAETTLEWFTLVAR